jgi:hypothetical protein
MSGLHKVQREDMFLVLVLCNLEEAYWRFGGTYRLHFQALAMGQANTSATSVNFYKTTRRNAQDTLIFNIN